MVPHTDRGVVAFQVCLRRLGILALLEEQLRACAKWEMRISPPRGAAGFRLGWG